MKIDIRPARVGDADAAVALLMLAAGDLLVPIFGRGETAQAQTFLRAAWQHRYGQYGADNHWVALYQGEVVGLVTGWHDQLPADFDRQTLAAITAFYGLDASMDVIMRSQQVTAALHPPLVKELAVGHLAVDLAHRRMGVGSALLAHMEQQARQRHKLSLVLDVHKSNTRALRFYTAQGFTERQALAYFIQMGRGVAPAA